MNTINMPGFTAEAALFRTSRHYQLEPAIGFSGERDTLLYPSFSSCQSSNGNSCNCRPEYCCVSGPTNCECGPCAPQQPLSEPQPQSQQPQRFPREIESTIARALR